jgi:hypothetical protein
MKHSSVGWSLFGLAAVAVIGYLLNGGLYIGSSIDVSMRQGEGKFLYSKSCHYLFLSGVRYMTSGLESPSREGAEATSCSLLGNSS